MKKSHEELIQDARAIAEGYYAEGKYLCSEAVLAAVNQVMKCGMPEEYVGLASGFPVGMGGAGCSCGALTGGQAALGLMFGRKAPGENNKKVMKLAGKLHDQFREQHSSTCCRVLIKSYKFGSKEHIQRCTRVTGDTAELVMRLILENQGFFSSLF